MLPFAYLSASVPGNNPKAYTSSQGALKGTNIRGQTEPKRRFSLIFADSRLSLENKAIEKRRFSQKTADFRRKPQKTAGTRRKLQIGVCPLRFVPLSAALVWKPCQRVLGSLSFVAQRELRLQVG